VKGPEKRVDLMGCPVDALTMEETLERVEALIAEGTPHQHMCVNAAKVDQMAHDPELRAAVRESALISADGVGVLIAGRILGVPLPERVTGIELMARLIERAAEKGWRPYFLGARPEVVEACVEHFRALHPNLEVAGYHHGYFDASEEEALVQGIRDTRSDLLFVALGTPQKEVFQHRWLPVLGIPFSMGVGGSFDVFAGRTPRSPAWARDRGLEWAWRLAHEPRRLWRRNFVENTRFLLRVARARVFGYRLPE